MKKWTGSTFHFFNGDCLERVARPSGYNAVAKSFFRALKNELVYHKDYKTRTEAKQSIFEYIEIFYNREWWHAFLYRKNIRVNDIVCVRLVSY